MTEFRPKARRPRGFTDRRGRDLAAERAIVERVLGVYESWGFERLETSAFEYADALGKFLPDQDRPNEGVFAVADDDEQWMALRYDLTAPLARFVAENFDALAKPYRRCAAGPVWRNEKPGPGRYREFWQCDADTVGSASPAADAEMIAMACAAFEGAGVGRGQVQIKINTRRLLNEVMDVAGVSDAGQQLGVLRALDKLDRLGLDGVQQLLGAGRKDESGDFTKGAGLSDSAIGKIMGFMARGAAQTRDAFLDQVGEVANVDDLRAIAEVLKALGVSDAQASFDLSIIRGLEYYTGAVFEAQLIGASGASFGSVGGGGRYDDLVSRFKGQPIPATGFSVGVSRLAAALAAQREEKADNPLVVVLPFDQSAIAACFGYAAELRETLKAQNVRAEVYLGGSGPKAQLKYADKRDAVVAVIVGGDEVANGTVTLKNLRLGAELAARETDREAFTKAQADIQKTVARDTMVQYVRAMLLGAA
jgi:histidyl-tRNA synthetase